MKSESTYPATANANCVGEMLELGVAPRQTEPVGVCCGTVGVARSQSSWAVTTGLAKANAGSESNTRDHMMGDETTDESNDKERVLRDFIWSQRQSAHHIHTNKHPST